MHLRRKDYKLLFSLGDMKIEVDFSKTKLFIILGVVLLLAGTFFVYAYGTNNPPVFGHTIQEVDGITCSAGQAVTRTNASGWSCVSITSGSSGVSSVTGASGSGIISSPTTGAVSLSADSSILQKRITGSCASGQAIRSVSDQGVVTCQAIAPIYCTYDGRTYSPGVKCNVGSGACGGGYSITVNTCQGDGSWYVSTESPTGSNCPYGSC